MVRCLALRLFGRSMGLGEMQPDPVIHGIGLSDWQRYAAPLAALYSYRNTFLDEEPRLDITAPPADLAGRLDFLIASDVFEHVAPPVDRAFDGAFALLKPGGSLIFSVPYVLEPQTVEHFPELYDFRLIESGGGHRLVNRRRDGGVELFDDLVFHGGPGQTLEMRVFGEADLLARLARAGFVDIVVHGEDDPGFGIFHDLRWGLPMTAIKPPAGGGALADRCGRSGRDPTPAPKPSQFALPDVDDKVVALIQLAERTGIEIGNPWQSSTVAADIKRLRDEIGVAVNRDVRFVSHRDIPGVQSETIFATSVRRFPPPRTANIRHRIFDGVPLEEYDVATPDFRVLTVPDGYFCQFLGAPLIVAADGETVIADYSSNYAGLVHLHPRQLRDLIHSARYVEGSVVPIADDVQVANIYHWVSDWLPRLAFLGSAVSRRPDLFVATAAIGAPFQWDSLRLCGFDADRVIPLANFTAIRARELLVPSNLGTIVHPGFTAAPWVLAHLRATLGFGAAMQAIRENSGGAGDRIYISRRDARARRIVNEPALLARLAGDGYREVVLSELPLVEQVATFARARRVIGAHGAGLVHFAFSPPGARLLEILPESYGLPGHYVIAAGLGNDYLSYVAEQVVPGINVSFDDVVVDVDDFDARCRDFYA